MEESSLGPEQRGGSERKKRSKVLVTTPFLSNETSDGERRAVRQEDLSAGGDVGACNDLADGFNQLKSD